MKTNFRARDLRTHTTQQDVERLTEDNASLRRMLKAPREEIDVLEAVDAARPR